MIPDYNFSKCCHHRLRITNAPKEEGATQEFAQTLVLLDSVYRAQERIPRRRSTGRVFFIFPAACTHLAMIPAFIALSGHSPQSIQCSSVVHCALARCSSHQRKPIALGMHTCTSRNSQNPNTHIGIAVLITPVGRLLPIREITPTNDKQRCHRSPPAYCGQH